MKSLKAKFRKTDSHEWSKNDERLLSAVEHGEMDKVSSLLSKKGASATKLDSEGKSALHVAATRGQTECLAVILAHGADASAADASGFSALHLAAKNSQQECAKKLLQSKCVVDALDPSGRSALHHAACNGNVVLVQLLCEHKCPVNLRDTDGLTALLLSARHSQAEVCAALLDWGANMDACDRNGRTAVMLATESSCGAAVDLLVQRGADLNVVDSLGHDILHYARLSGNAEVCSIIDAALQQLPEPDKTSSRTPQHDHMAKLHEDRSSTPKKRKAPPPPVSPLQSPVLSPPYMTPSETPVSSRSDLSKRFNYKEEDLRSVALTEEIERLQEEKSLLLETIEDLKQTVAQAEPKDEQEVTLVAALQAKVASLSLENQQLAQLIKKRPAPQGEEGQQDSCANSFDSNVSYHSTCADLDEEELSAFGDPVKCQHEVMLLKDALRSLQGKLDQSRLESRSLQARLKPVSDVKETGNEGLKAKPVDAEGEDQLVQKFQYLKSCLEQEVKDLKSKLAKSEEEKTRAASLIKELEARLEGGHLTEDERQELKNSYTVLVESLDQEKALLVEKYEDGQVEIKMLQEALLGTVSVEAAAKDFEEMKAEMGGVIDGLQRRLIEMSKSFSETKSELSLARSKLQALEADMTKNVVCSTKEEHEHKTQELNLKLKDIQKSLKEVDLKHQAAQKEIAQLKQSAETQAQSTVSLSDHTQVVASLGNAIKSLEAELEAHKQQLAQRNAQMDALQAEMKVSQGDRVSKQEHEKIRASLQSEITRLTQLLQVALRKQDEMALEVTKAWQEVKEGKAEKEAAQKLAVTKEQECHVLNGRCREAQDATTHLKKQVENHVNSERDKNKKIDDLSKEVGKLKDALNSLSQLSYATSSPKRQQIQQVDSLQQQIKQLQYQLTEAKKRHHEIVSVYRMHLLYAVQGQMDEDVQKALKQILLMCKVPTEDK